jgi:tol-pal system protein YbgF
LDELANAQSRLELRVEEVTRNLLVLRSRLDGQEAALKQPEQARGEQSPPQLKVVKLEPAPKEITQSAASPSSSQQMEGQASDLYRKAFNNYREGKFGEAILDFEEFLRRYPNHEYADNAQYWIGESYYSQAEYEQAVVEFNRVLDRYPHEAKAPDALLKIGICYQRLGDLNRARVFWSRLVAQHPESETARQAQKLLSSKP